MVSGVTFWKTSEAFGARRCRQLAGVFWAASLLLIGLLLLDWQILTSNPATSLFVLLGPSWQLGKNLCLYLAIMLIVGSQLVFMVLVADEACPDAPMVITGPAKLAIGLSAWGSLVAAIITLLGR